MAVAKTPIHFGNFNVTSQVFHITTYSFALVNLKPILPGHVLVSPRRVTARFSDLSPAEVADLFMTVQKVGRTIERFYKASSLNIAIQDGADAGQSVPHVHTHVIPRKRADLDHKGGSDAIYSMIDGEEGDIGNHLKERSSGRPQFPSVENESRKPRTEAEMAKEARVLANEMESL
ncbi:MAG: hypothetical protein Q9163_000129 [Psora crenata]